MFVWVLVLSKRCLKRLESGSKCHWLEVCLFYLISWMAYLEGGRAGEGIWHVPCPGRSWSETVRSGPKLVAGGGKGMQNRVTITDSGFGR